ncbi:Cro protein [Gordonia phage Neville]|uniref:Cro protein n=2 Tax=Nevillevirus TaxID=3044773 RepID=A0A515MGX7_9CAUD|nr:Cro protein [Gordonia phage Neville]YP_010246026.1 Cro protein [Gordonia phage Trax]AXQ64413.1 Cro protein [Gordonia phage Neville]QDM55928.1 Cro protein [Gordonia phage Trax]
MVSKFLDVTLVIRFTSASVLNVIETAAKVARSRQTPSPIYPRSTPAKRPVSTKASSAPKRKTEWQLRLNMPMVYRLMDDHGFSGATDMAVHCKASRDTMSRAFRGDGITSSLACKVATALGVHPNEISRFQDVA